MSNNKKSNGTSKYGPVLGSAKEAHAPTERSRFSEIR